MFYLDPNNLFDKSLSHARVVSSMQNFYVGIRRSVGKSMAVAIASVVAVPFGLWLRKQRNDFLKIARKSNTDFTNSREYIECKEMITRLEKFVPVLNTISQYKLERAPLLVRFVLNQMQKTSLAILEMHNSFLKKVERYNTSKFKSAFNRVNFVPEKELWESRNKAYEYWF